MTTVRVNKRENIFILHKNELFLSSTTPKNAVKLSEYPYGDKSAYFELKWKKIILLKKFVKKNK